MLASIEKKERTVRVMQFGEGNFLRAFADYILQTANEKGLTDTNVAIVNPLAFDLPERFANQKCNYNVVVRGLQDGKEIDSEKIITVVEKTVSPSSELDAYKELYLSPDLRFVISNTTEAGIVLDKEDDFNLPYPKSFPGKVTKLLFERFEHFGGAADKGLFFLPVELIEDNGKQLKRCVLELAKIWNLGDAFAKWVDEACVFASTLVDRIVSGYPRDTIEMYDKRLGYHDDLLVVTEPYYLWVIEADERLHEELPLDQVIPQVVFAPIRPYRERKVRLLNGSHTILTPVALLWGKTFVRECMGDEKLAAYLEKAVMEEILPGIDCLPREELVDFYHAVRERFANPFMDHALMSISLNTVSKYHARVLPSVEAYCKANGKAPRLLTFAFAATLAFLTKEEKVQDTEDILAFLAAHREDEAEALMEAVFAEGIFAKEMRALPGFEAMALADLKAIRAEGIEAALKKAMEE